MSQFVGPVHYRMFEKIRALDARTDLLLSGHQEELAETIDTECGKLAQGPLDTVIDTDNIHGWLSRQVEIAECRHAQAVHSLLGLGETVDSLKEKQTAQATGSCEEDMQQNFFLLDTAFLDGMPCDHSLSVTEKDETSLCFAVDEQAHETYWHLGTPVSVYEELRFDAMQKQAKACGMRMERQAPFRYILHKEG